jgi:hypothetical protein
MLIKNEGCYVMLFAIDDSDVQIEDRSHTILAAIGTRDLAALESALDTLKLQFGLMSADEVKWNGMRPMPQHAREALSQELMTLLHRSVPLVVINEGRNKQIAAERIAVQIADFARRQRSLLTADEPIELTFDEGILDDESGYAQYLHTLDPSPVASASITIVRSHENAAIQLADVLAGFNRVATCIALGRANKNLLLRDGQLDIKLDLLSYISLSLRWATWGEVPPPPNPDNVVFDANWPFKHVGGYGLRIHSTISARTIEKIYQTRVVYMGCLR